MLLLVGLGNPGPRHARNRHNIGFLAAEAVADRHGFGPARRRFEGEVREGVLGGRKTLVLKPLTYMNESGRAVGEAMRFYRLAPADVVVFHDELDLPPGKLRVKLGGGNAGHNGLRSIKAHLHTDAFVRVRIGVGKPPSKERGGDHVLSRMPTAMRREMDVAIQIAADAVELILADGPDAAMRLVHAPL